MIELSLLRISQLERLIFLGDGVPDFFDQSDSIRNAELAGGLSQLILHGPIISEQIEIIRAVGAWKIVPNLFQAEGKGAKP